MLRLALLIVALSPLMVAGGAHARPLPLFGFNDDLPALLEHRLFARALGANAARVPIGWTYEPESFESADDTLRAAGQLPIINLMGPEKPPAAAYAQQAADWALAYPENPIQLWNEPNHRLFGNMGAHAAAEFILRAVRSIWAVNPDQQIIGPALAPGPGRRMSLEMRRYQNALYRALPDSIGVGLHVFVYSDHPMRVVKDRYRRARKQGKVWVTEAGFFGASFGHRQAFVSGQGLRKLTDLGAEAVIFHRLAPIDPLWGWEEAGSMSVLDDPALATALKEARAGRR